MSKKTRNRQKPDSVKATKSGKAPGGEKIVSQAHTPNLDAKIAWNFMRMDGDGDWACDLLSLHDYHQKLISFEGKTIRELFVRGQGGGSHNHRMPVERLCQKACNRLDACNIDEDALYQLDFGTPVRLWGVLQHNIFHILWLDKDHSVYPMKR